MIRRIRKKYNRQTFPVLNEALEYSSNFYSDSFDYYDLYRYGINTIAHLKTQI